MAFTRIRSGLLWAVGLTSLVIVIFQFRYDVAKMIFGSPQLTETDSKSGLQAQISTGRDSKSGRRQPIDKAAWHGVGRPKEHVKKELRARVKPANDTAVARGSKNAYESMEDATQPKYLVMKKPGHKTAVEGEDLERSEPNINTKCLPMAQLNVKKLEACGDWIRTCHSECRICEEERHTPVQIPRLVHFIKDENLTFSDWLAIVASKKYIKPIKINLFTREGVLPNCWMRRLNLIDHVKVLKLSQEHWLENLNNVTVAYVEHQSDLLRNAILYHYGGIYMDTDAYATKSFDPLLSNYSVVLGRNLVNKVGNGLIIAQRRSCLICQYASDACDSFDGSWTKHSTISLSNLINKTSEDSNLLVLNYSSGFFPFSWKRKHFHQLFDLDSSQVPFSSTQVYALHLFGSKFTEQIAERFRDLEWITQTPSILASYIRTVINSELLKPSHLDENLCVDLPPNLIS